MAEDTVPTTPIMDHHGHVIGQRLEAKDNPPVSRAGAASGSVAEEDSEDLLTSPENAEFIAEQVKQFDIRKNSGSALERRRP